MADWTDISTASLEVGAPARSVDVIAMRDNIIAQSEGAVGAPKTLNAAIADGAVTSAKILNGNVTAPKIPAGQLNRSHILSPIAGTAYILCRAVTAELITPSNTFVTVGIANITASGVITAYLQQASSGFTVESRILKNGVQVALWSSSSTSYIARQINIAVSKGDAIEFQHRTVISASNPSKIRNCRIYSGNDSIAAS